MGATAYFHAVASPVARAQRSVLIAGWDIDSRVSLWWDEGDSGLPRRLGEFVNAVALPPQRPRHPRAAWEFALLYALEREPLAVFQPVGRPTAGSPSTRASVTG